MPTYVVTTTPSRLTAQQKQVIVDRVTEIHAHEGGGVPQWLVQVIFKTVEPGNIFINKRPQDEQIWIRGDIRAGRSDEQKTKMVERMMAECAQGTGIEQSYFWVYICDAEKTGEFGAVLPQPGEEAAWVARLSKDVRDRYGLY